MIYCLTMSSGVHRLVDLPPEVMPTVLERFMQRPETDDEGNPLPDDFGWLVVEPDTVINLNEVDAIQRHYPPEYFAFKAGEGLWDDDGVESGELAREAYFLATVAVQAVKEHGQDVAKVAEAIAKAHLEGRASTLPGDDHDY